MERKNQPFPFANDGSFLEKFKQLQEQAGKLEQTAAPPAAPVPVSSGPPKKAVLIPASASSKLGNTSRTISSSPSTSTTAGGKLAFSLKQKSKLPVNPIKLSEDEDEDEDLDGSEPDRRRSDQSENSIPPPPKDPEVMKVAEKLALFVAKNGRQFEDLTRQKNPGDTPFRFLFDTNCSDYKYYAYRLSVETKALSVETKAKTNISSSGTNSTTTSLQSDNQSSKARSYQHSNYQTPASALYGDRGEDDFTCHASMAGPAECRSSADSLTMMEFYMQKAAQEEKHKPPKRSRDEMPSPASLQAPSPPVKKGHHMGDYIPPEELEKFLSKCNDAAVLKVSREAAECTKIQPDNVGHRLLSKMGWKEGEGLGSGKDGRAVPVEAGTVKMNNLGVGAEQPGEVTPDDDIYEQYKKRMMLGYRFRPNPLNNPRKAYY